jgi:hypothetical protein
VKEALAAASEAMSADQTVTRCADEGCLRCRDSTAGGPLGAAALG